MPTETFDGFVSFVHDNTAHVVLTAGNGDVLHGTIPIKDFNGGDLRKIFKYVVTYGKLTKFSISFDEPVGKEVEFEIV